MILNIFPGQDSEKHRHKF